MVPPRQASLRHPSLQIITSPTNLSAACFFWLRPFFIGASPASCLPTKIRSTTSSPNLAFQRFSISTNNSGQILMVFLPLAAERTIHSARIPRPLPQPSRNSRPTCACIETCTSRSSPAAGCSAMNPHLSRQPIANFICVTGASARAARSRTETLSSVTNRITLLQTPNDKPAPRYPAAPSVAQTRYQTQPCTLPILAKAKPTIPEDFLHRLCSPVLSDPAPSFVSSCTS
jgi:hypothetical protein